MKSQIEGFTPVFDGVLEQTDYMTALVYGKIWRYCQMGDKTCWASKVTLAEQLKLSESTVYRYVLKLIELGYVVEIGNTGRGKVYKVTEKEDLEVSITTKSGNKKMSERRVTPVTVTGLTIQPDRQRYYKIQQDTNTLPEKIEPEREPCDPDGITESMELGYGGVKPPRKKLLSSSERALAEFFSEYTGLKLPRAETKRDYSKMQVTWWKPIKAMLYEVDDDLEEAKDILSYTIDKMQKDGLSYSSPQSIHKMFLAQVAKEHSKQS